MIGAKAVARNGRVRLLGVTTAQRVGTAANILTLTERGVAVVSGGWHMLVVPKATPPADMVNQLNKAWITTTSAPMMRESLLKAGSDLANTSPTEVEKILVAEWQRWGKIARDAAVQAD